MKKEIEGTFNEGYAVGREYYTNDISKQIHEIKIAIRALDNFVFSNETRLIKEELFAASHVLESVLKISKKPY